ncbi:hypothetical protein [Streptomyces sp. NPDC002676]
MALLVLAVTVAVRLAGACLGARLSRLTRWQALALGAGMKACGAIEVIVAGQPVARRRTCGCRLGRKRPRMADRSQQEVPVEPGRGFGGRST